MPLLLAVASLCWWRRRRCPDAASGSRKRKRRSGDGCGTKRVRYHCARHQQAVPPEAYEGQGSATEVVVVVPPRLDHYQRVCDAVVQDLGELHPDVASVQQYLRLVRATLAYALPEARTATRLLSPFLDPTAKHPSGVVIMGAPEREAGYRLHFARLDAVAARVKTEMIDRTPLVGWTTERLNAVDRLVRGRLPALRDLLLRSSSPTALETLASVAFLMAEAPSDGAATIGLPEAIIAALDALNTEVIHMHTRLSNWPEPFLRACADRIAEVYLNRFRSVHQVSLARRIFAQAQAMENYRGYGGNYDASRRYRSHMEALDNIVAIRRAMDALRGIPLGTPGRPTRTGFPLPRFRCRYMCLCDRPPAYEPSWRRSKPLSRSRCLHL